MKCCKTCKYWDRDKAKDKGGIIWSDRTAPCLFPAPKLPESCSFNVQNIELRWMAPDYGQKCDVYEPLTQEANR